MKNKYTPQQIIFILSVIKHNGSCFAYNVENIFNKKDGSCSGDTIKECPFCDKCFYNSMTSTTLLDKAKKELKKIPIEDIFEAKLIINCDW